jgi:hypothetical protein
MKITESSAALGLDPPSAEQKRGAGINMDFGGNGRTCYDFQLNVL